MQTVITTLLPLWHWLCAHEIVWWILGSAVINLLLRIRSVESWLSLCDKVPRLASLIRLLRAIGVDPVKLVVSGVAVVNGKARVDLSRLLPGVVVTEPTIIPAIDKDTDRTPLDVIPAPPKVPIIRDTDPNPPGA